MSKIEYKSLEELLEDNEHLWTEDLDERLGEIVRIVIQERANTLLEVERIVRNTRDKYDITRTNANDSPYGLPTDPIDAAKRHDHLEQSKMAITFEFEVLLGIERLRSKNIYNLAHFKPKVKEHKTHG